MSKYCPLRGIPCDKNCAWHMEAYGPKELDQCAILKSARVLKHFDERGILAYDKV